jgi:hypothetical protein
MPVTSAGAKMTSEYSVYSIDATQKTIWLNDWIPLILIFMCLSCGLLEGSSLRGRRFCPLESTAKGNS